MKRTASALVLLAAVQVSNLWPPGCESWFAPVDDLRARLLPRVAQKPDLNEE